MIVLMRCVFRVLYGNFRADEVFPVVVGAGAVAHFAVCTVQGATAHRSNTSNRENHRGDTERVEEVGV